MSVLNQSFRGALADMKNTSSSSTTSSAKSGQPAGKTASSAAPGASGRAPDGSANAPSKGQVEGLRWWKHLLRQVFIISSDPLGVYSGFAGVAGLVGWGFRRGGRD
jgi:hypothetical protein